MLSSLVLFIFTALFLYLSSQALVRRLLRLTNPNLVFFLLLPGIFLHEFSHLFMATLLRVPTGHLSLKPELKNHHLKLGSAQIGQTDPLRLTLIGTAPFISGTIVLWLLTTIGLSLSLSAFNLASLTSIFLLPAYQLVLFIYLLFATANTMFSSPSDLQSAGFSIILFILIFTTLKLANYSIPPSLTASFAGFFNLLSSLFTLTLTLNLFILLPLKLFRKNVLH